MRLAPSYLDQFNRMLDTRTTYRDGDADLYRDRYRLRTAPALIPVITRPGTGDHDAVERLITMLWNGRSRCRGTADHDALEPSHTLRTAGLALTLGL